MSNIARTCAALAVLAGSPLLADQAPDAGAQDYLDQQRRPISMLEPGEWRLSLGIGAALQGREYGIGSANETDITATIAISHGLTPGIEIFADSPISYTRDSETFLGATTFEDDTWTGTATVGARAMLLYETGSLPELVGSVSFGHPVGDSTGAEPNIRVGIEAFSIIDPVTLFAGFGLAAGLDTGAIVLDWSAGLDFAVSDRLSLGTALLYSSDSSRLGDPQNDGASVRLTANIASPSSTAVWAPYIGLGLTDQASDAAAGVTWSYQW